MNLIEQSGEIRYQTACILARMDNQATVGILDQFQNDLVEFWRKLPNKAFFFVLLLAWLALFQFLGNPVLGVIKTNSLYVWMLEAYMPSDTGNDFAHGKIIPFLVLALFWWKRHELLASNIRIWLPGMALLIAGIMLHVVGYLIQQPAVSIVALFTGIYGLMGLAWGPEWLRRSMFPFCLFIFSIPLGSQIDKITIPLRFLVTHIVEFISNSVLALDVVREGNALIHNDILNPKNRYQYEVAAACAGMRSLVAIGLMATVCAFVFFKSWSRRLLLLASAVPLAVAGNVLRLLAIVIAAEIGGQSWGDYVHKNSFFSMLPYVPAILGLMWAISLLEEKKGSPKP
jgi:exosortase